jgi:hypothetical protein
MLDHATTQSSAYENWGLNQVRDWQLKFCWTPNRCALSGIDLWGQQAYRGAIWRHSPGMPVKDVYWIDRDEFIMWRLKNV